ncbi:unnamed protein product, partial [Onchocerca ochengi]|uniref:P4Ha_N domain-containing protein n=1 Tax=Onchocerca ochengi TaxID=42157 RepID=A0A182EX54_ONCOC
MTRQKITIKRISYPTKEDLSGAAIGLLRLQDTYQMNIQDIAKGKILNSQMRAEARERVEKEAIQTANLEDILEYLAFSLYIQGNLKRALLLTDELYRM